MGVLEITFLHLKPGTKHTDPALLSNLQSIRSQLGTNSRFFVRPHPDGQGSGSVLILGVWPSLQAHQDFLNSKEKDKVLGPQESQTSFVWAVHVDLGEGKGMEVLSSHAWRAISVLRLITPNSSNQSHDEEACRETLEAAVKNPGAGCALMLDKWSVDPERGTIELVCIVGWEDLGNDGSGQGLFRGQAVESGPSLGNVTVIEEFGYDLEDEAIGNKAISSEVEGGR